MATESDIREALRQVLDPEVGVNIVDLGLIYRIEVEELGRWRSWSGLRSAFALLVFALNTGRSMAVGGTRGESV